MLATNPLTRWLAGIPTSEQRPVAMFPARRYERESEHSVARYDTNLAAFPTIGYPGMG
jgi:hypothetical protein